MSDIDTGVVVSLKVLDPDGRLEKRTSTDTTGMSALCQLQPFAPQQYRRYSITSSARASSVGSMSKRSAFALFRLITSSYLMVPCTGRSAGILTLENAVDVISCVDGLIDDFRSIRDQAAGGNEVSRCEDRTKLASEMQKLEAYKKQMLASPDQQISLTDSDCRSIATSGRGSGVVRYNVQVAVETGHISSLRTM